MKASDIRDELLDQHAGLRDQIVAARLAAEGWSRGELSQADVHARLAELADALRVHHLREERAVSQLIRSLDGFLDEEHANEHRQLLDDLARVSRAQNAGDGGRELERFCERVLAHLTHEERTFLNTSVLQEDVP